MRGFRPTPASGVRGRQRQPRTPAAAAGAARAFGIFSLNDRAVRRLHRSIPLGSLRWRSITPEPIVFPVQAQHVPINRGCFGGHSQRRLAGSPRGSTAVAPRQLLRLRQMRAIPLPGASVAGVVRLVCGFARHGCRSAQKHRRARCRAQRRFHVRRSHNRLNRRASAALAPAATSGSVVALLSSASAGGSSLVINKICGLQAPQPGRNIAIGHGFGVRFSFTLLVCSIGGVLHGRCGRCWRGFRAG
jgi:hypothetical protein